MDATGLVRRTDSLGRIVLPIEVRRGLNIDVQDPVEIFVEDEYIVLKRYEHSCCLCGQYNSTLKKFKGKLICTDCVGKLLMRYYPPQRKWP